MGNKRKQFFGYKVLGMAFRENKTYDRHKEEGGGGGNGDFTYSLLSIACLYSFTKTSTDS